MNHTQDMIMAILSILLTVLPELIYCMDGDVVSNNSVGVLLTSSQYCFVNEFTIRINHSDVNIINSTEDWIIASNNIDQFMVPANGTNCTSSSSVDPYSDAVNIILSIVIIATVLVAAANVILHLFIKELQTVSGVLIVSLCVAIILTHTLFIVHINQGNSDVCAVMFYMGLVFYFVYDSSKMSTLIHFAYLMYQSYKTSENSGNKLTVLYKYAILIVSLSIVCSGSVVLVDTLGSRIGYKTTHGQCIVGFNPSNQGTATIALLVILLTMFNVVEIGLMIAGLFLYYLTKRQCCAIPTRDVKISIALNCNIGINTGLAVILLYLGVAGGINFVVSNTGTLIEQILLFLLFFTSNKVLSKLCATYHTVITSNTVISSSEEKTACD
ncbi:uncharacterized protein [Dysidea avara]|uniref:uncharacterized protein isoform X1 n=2 Tax=Dysidea avara TaxID=196820 RepID=UPI003323848C